MGRTWMQQLPPGVPDPMFLHDLALEMGLPVAEMCERMSAHELTVEWIAYYEARDFIRAQEEAEQAGPRRVR